MEEDVTLVIRFLEVQIAALVRQGPSDDLAHRWNELGSAYYDRGQTAAQGDADREKALQAFQRALEIFTRETNPKWWAAVHFNMGTALCDLQADRAASVDRAIECFRQTLDVYREQDPDSRYDWATSQYELGLAYGQRLLGSRRENLLTSIAHYQEALKVFNLQDFPDNYAMTQQNLAASFANFANVP
jgi:tetratricopeptide (TPR) repeat protein